ncbi:MAG: nucleic acid-binding protein [Phycisphaerae bacterium]|nr:nucleic acid-binding protein [Phycisphaerae bacterium]NUQ46548.1 nucleic acid-binding protein [Phycisphaerae bacterium]
MRTIVLDAGPLGMLSHRGGIPEVDSCKAWLERLPAAGERVIVPEISDNEVRRELIRLGSTASIERLDNLGTRLGYLPLTTSMMRAAAELWARSRSLGRATADRHALDGDVILAAQTRSLGVSNVVIATTNVSHLALLSQAAEWSSL